MIKRILKTRFLLLLILLISIALVACSNESKPAISDVPQTNEQEVEKDAGEDLVEDVEEDVEDQIDRFSEIIDTSQDKGKFSIYFLHLPRIEGSDNKSGDSSLLISPDGEVMLIDAGLSQSAAHIISFLEELGIEKIDYFVASHPHIDHIGGFPTLADKFDIGKVYQNDMEYTTNTYHDFINTIKGKNIPVEYLKEGDQITFGNEIQVKIYNPPADYEYPKEFPKSSTQFINDNSLVMKFTYGESTALFAGDIYRTKERDLVTTYGDKLQADVIKANHHGGDTSNSNPWIKTIQPQIVVAIHEKIDSMSVYDRFVKQGTDYYNTALNGFVKVIIDDEKNYTVINQLDNWNNEKE